METRSSSGDGFTTWCCSYTCIYARWNTGTIKKGMIVSLNEGKQKGTIKGLTASQVRGPLQYEIILANTYHLGHRPGPEVLNALHGIHHMMGWSGNLLTDSGGFQMVSLLKLAQVTEEGVRFESPHDGSEMVLTPEHSIYLQNQIGSDIMMQLDDVVHSSTTGPRLEEAMLRSVRWLDRCLVAHDRSAGKQNLFAIVQGGLDADLRRRCAAEMIKRDVPGFAIGGLSGGEEKDKFWRMVALSCELLPTNKPRYLMGVGYAEDLVVCTALGCDMFDCVFPTRTGRFGTALTFGGPLNLKRAEFKDDHGPIDNTCECEVCAKYTRSFLHLGAGKEISEVGLLVSYHNLHFQKALMTAQREAIRNGTYNHFVMNFLLQRYGSIEATPSWITEALTYAGLELGLAK